MPDALFKDCDGHSSPLSDISLMLAIISMLLLSSCKDCCFVSLSISCSRSSVYSWVTVLQSLGRNPHNGTHLPGCFVVQLVHTGALVIALQWKSIHYVHLAMNDDFHSMHIPRTPNSAVHIVIQHPSPAGLMSSKTCARISVIARSYCLFHRHEKSILPTYFAAPDGNFLVLQTI